MAGTTYVNIDITECIFKDVTSVRPEAFNLYLGTFLGGVKCSIIDLQTTGHTVRKCTCFTTSDKKDELV